ncbi:uncharacterized protein [Rutidosis leptorrhynchoides]|uniref:uncharacterized protein n=1 Tax=Rutidosis leptorrhynchoides TaxID=125765 RepID=UPI003A99EC42
MVWSMSFLVQKQEDNLSLLKLDFEALMYITLYTISLCQELIDTRGGHAATTAVRAAKMGLVKPTAIAVVATTWPGSLSIIFTHDSNTKMKAWLHISQPLK